MTFPVSEVVVSQTFYYTPALYLEHCETSGEDPSEEGLIAFLKPEIDQDFGGHAREVFVRYTPSILDT